MGERVAFVGSRGWPDDQAWVIGENVAALSDDDTVMSGGARGVDSIAETTARALRLAVVLSYRPFQLKGTDLYGVKLLRWEYGELVLEVVLDGKTYRSYGQACFGRNVMIAHGCDRMEAYQVWPETPGTRHVVKKATDQHKPVRLYHAA